MRVVIIGSGNVATVLGRRVLLAGHEIGQVVARNAGHAASLAGELGGSWSDDWANIRRDAGLYIVALSDSALLSFSSRVSLPDKLVAHTAGAVAQGVLINTSKQSGVLYPLQSLSKEAGSIPEIPFLVSGNSPDSLQRITAFARGLSEQVVEADDSTRLKLHLAGVLVNNFSNHLYTLAAEFCGQEGIDFKLLLPLIMETASRLAYMSPLEAQTGPAARGDETTIEKHINLLDNYDDIRDLYRLFTIQIHERIRKI
jgi:predicted short-subunit dehydrogenase-like oxidoreductase (DUF2520 family)